MDKTSSTSFAHSSSHSPAVTAVAGNAQVGLIQLVSLLAGAGNPIYFNCLKIELTKYVD